MCDAAGLDIARAASCCSSAPPRALCFCAHFLTVAYCLPPLCRRPAGVLHVSIRTQWLANYDAREADAATDISYMSWGQSGRAAVVYLELFISNSAHAGSSRPTLVAGSIAPCWPPSAAPERWRCSGLLTRLRWLGKGSHLLCHRLSAPPLPQWPPQVRAHLLHLRSRTFPALMAALHPSLRQAWQVWLWMAAASVLCTSLAQ